MERKMKKTAALSATVIAVLATVPSAVLAKAESTDSFTFPLDCNEVLIDNIADCEVKLSDGEIRIDVTVNQTYTLEELRQITGKPKEYPCIWFENEKGIVWNPDECLLDYSCSESLEIGGWRVIQKTFLYPDGINPDGRYYTIFRKNDMGLMEGEHFGCTVTVLENVPQTVVKVFGRDYLVTNSLLADAPENAPVSTDTAEETVPEMPETSLTAVDIGVLSNLKNMGTDISCEIAETESETQVTETQVTSSETTTTTTVTETTMTVTETEPVIQKMQESTVQTSAETAMTTTTAETTVSETEQEWKVVQVMLPTETTAETSEPKKEFPIIPTLAGNVAAILVGVLVKIKFF